MSSARTFLPTGALPLSSGPMFLMDLCSYKNNNNNDYNNNNNGNESDTNPKKVATIQYKTN
jgi:hypothetical protein